MNFFWAYRGSVLGLGRVIKQAIFLLHCRSFGRLVVLLRPLQGRQARLVPLLLVLRCTLLCMLGSRIPGLFRFRSQLRRRSSLFFPSRCHISLDLQPKTSILHSLLFNSLRNCQNKNHFHRYPVSKKSSQREREREFEQKQANSRRSRTRRPQQKGKKQHSETLLKIFFSSLSEVPKKLCFETT